MPASNNDFARIVQSRNLVSRAHCVRELFSFWDSPHSKLLSPSRERERERERSSCPKVIRVQVVILNVLRRFQLTLRCALVKTTKVLRMATLADRISGQWIGRPHCVQLRFSLRKLSSKCRDTAAFTYRGTSCLDFPAFHSWSSQSNHEELLQSGYPSILRGYRKRLLIGPISLLNQACRAPLQIQLSLELPDIAGEFTGIRKVLKLLSVAGLSGVSDGATFSPKTPTRTCILIARSILRRR